MNTNDLTGQRFNRLTVIKKAEDAISPKGYHTKQYLCQCDCGNQVIVRGNKLTSGSTKSCGCYRKEVNSKIRIDLTGKRFGKLFVKNRISGSDWLCICDCGNEVTRKTGALTSGNTKGCGKCRAEDLTNKDFRDIHVIERSKSSPSGDVVQHCMCKKCGAEFYYTKTQLKNISADECPVCRQKYEDLTGQQFGRLAVKSRTSDQIYPDGSKKIRQNCLCDCGKHTVASSNLLKRGEKRSCGCLHQETMKTLSELRTLDITEQRFGRLVAKYRLNNNRKYWHCVCDCGNECDVITSRLTSGTTKSCGCLQKERAGAYAFKDLTGQNIGFWTVLYKAGHTDSGTILQHCRCNKCGEEYDVNAGNLRLGTTMMCTNCSHKDNGEKLRLNLVGYQFGKLTVLQFAGIKNNHTQQLCRCECGKEKIVPSASLTSGNTRSCGCWHKSKYEEQVMSYLDNMGFDYTTQVKFSDLTGINGGLLSYDFGIYQHGDITVLIECQGQQHYKPIDIFGGKEQFEVQQLHDELKSDYAEEIGAILIEVPYTVNDYDEMETLLNEKLSDIVTKL